MALELFQPNRKRRSFFDNLTEDAAPTDYQPSPSGYPSLVRAPGIEPQETQAPAPAPNYPPPPQPPEMEPVSRGRRIGAAFAAFAARFGGAPGAGTRVGQQIIQAPYQQKIADYRRQYEAWKSQAEYGEAQEERGRTRAGETRAQQVHGRYESPQDELARRAQEAEAQGLTGEEAQRYTLTGKMPQEPAGRRAGLWEETFIKEHGRPPTLEEVQAHEQSVRAPIPAPATKGQLAAAENRKNVALRRLEASYRWTVSEEGSFYVNPTTRERLTPDQFRKLKQQIQDDYEAELEALGRTPKPFEYPSGGGPSTSPTQGGEGDPLEILPKRP